MEQNYPGESDHVHHFFSLLPAFKDRRYIKINGKPIFGIFEPTWLPNAELFIKLWNKLAKENGLSGIYFVGLAQTKEIYSKTKDLPFDAINTNRLKDFIPHQNPLKEYFHYKCSDLHVYDYSKVSKYFVSEEDLEEKNIPMITTGWDHTPRSGRTGLVLNNYTPIAFEKHVRDVFNILSRKENKLCFVKAWNEWGEGNHLEPDLKWGKSFFEVIKRVKNEYEG